MPKGKQEQTAGETETEDSTTESEKDGGEEGDVQGLEWGFGFTEKEEEETSTKKTGTEEGDEPDKVKLLEQELKKLRTQVQLDRDLKELSNKYGNKEGFPEVDKQKIITFLEGDFNKVPPLELGYIMANFSEIMNAKDANASKKAEEKYSPEALESEKTKASNQKEQDKFAELGARLQKKFGVFKREK